VTADPASGSSGIGSEDLRRRGAVAAGIARIAGGAVAIVEPGAAVTAASAPGATAPDLLADDLLDLLLHDPRGLSASKMARRLGRRKATVLAELRANAWFKPTGRGPGTRWILTSFARGTVLQPELSVPVGQPDPEPVSAVAGAQSGSQRADTRSTDPTLPASPLEGSKKKRRPPIRRIGEARQVDQVAERLGIPVTVAPDLTPPWKRTRTRRTGS
jgi:hypothetical protein